MIAGNRKAKNPNERIVNSYCGHLGPVYALERNPFYTKVGKGYFKRGLWGYFLKMRKLDFYDKNVIFLRDSQKIDL